MMSNINNTKQQETAIILMHCADQQGIVAKVTEFLDNNNGNIINLEQHVDHEENHFFMRVEWELTNFLIPKDKIDDFFGTQIAAKYGMKWELYLSGKTPGMAIFVTRMNHCLFDILSRYQAGDLAVEIPLIISNHNTLKPVADRFEIPFHHFPVNKENKDELEGVQLELMANNQVDFIVLARYMQILSKKMVDAYPNKIINIHHSFLPAFPGAKPYHSAHKRGVKIIGATSHYVTEDLDEGPIIEQAVTRISHLDSVKNLVQKGQDLEKIVLSRAVQNHLERKILVYKNKTIVFN